METKKLKILNLYACLGGNRYKWGDEHQITAVELDPYIAEMYQKRFPNDKVIVADAHEYLLNHYNEFDFIWSSPPCPSHSRAAFGSRKSNKSNHKPCYPDFTLYEEIIFLQYYFNGNYVVENVNPYYDPIILAKKRGRHLYWTSFKIPSILSNRISIDMESRNEKKQWEKFHDIYNIDEYKGKQSKVKILRNLVDYVAGETILNCLLNLDTDLDKRQLKMF